MEDEKIKVVKNWPEAKSVNDIQVFIRFANFYWQFIQSFSKIASSFTPMLKTQPASDIQLQVNWIIVEILLVAVLILMDLDQTKNCLSPENPLFQVTTEL